MSKNFIKREEMRQTVNEIKKKEKQLNKIESENSDHIMKEINELKANIESKLELLSNKENKSDLQKDLEIINNEYEKVSKYINESTLYLAKYNIKLSQIILNSLRTKIDDKKDSLFPKSKFSFKKTFVSKPNSIDVSLKSNSNTTDFTDSAINKPFNVESIPFIGFKNICNSEKPLRILSEDSNGKDLQIECLENCVIEIFGAPNALKINNLLNCKLFCGPIITSIFIANCQKSIFHIAGQQLRVHTSSDCDIYLHVSSRAIIEDSKRIRFAPYDWSYDNISNDFKTSNLDQNMNNWKQIDDFDCLTTDESSPNWSFIN